MRADASDPRMSTREINIWGSCVSRDSVEFARGAAMGMYCARQSIVSAVAEPVSEPTLAALEFKETTHPFHRRLVEEDFRKTSLDQLCTRQPDGVIILDLIEERVALGITRCGTCVTFSQAASGFSNARVLIDRMIPAYSEEHVDLFGKAIGEFAARLANRTVVVHRALYAEGDWEFENANRVLNQFYDMAIASLDSPLVIDVDRQLRASSRTHKWGFAPYHYVDGYYEDFVGKLAVGTGLPVSVKPGFTLQKSN